MVKNTDQKHWRSLSEISTNSKVNEEYSEEQEFLYTNENLSSSKVTRRGFIGLLSASMALASTSCRRPDHKIVPVVKGLESVTPGLPLFYTTVFCHGTSAIGLLVKSREGRPVKIEGNNLHPASRGAASSWIQGSLLNLYDPERMKTPFLNKGGLSPDNNRSAPGNSSPETVITTIAELIRIGEQNGKKTVFLIKESPSPSFQSLIKEIESSSPTIKFVTLPAIQLNNIVEANKIVLGIDAEIAVDYSKAETILSVDADFLGTDKNAITNIQGFTKHRKIYNSQEEKQDHKAKMNGLIVVESTMSLTGMNADHRIKIAPKQYLDFLGAILKHIATNQPGKVSQAIISSIQGNFDNQLLESTKKIAELLLKNGEKSIIIVGSHLPIAAHALGLLINQILGSVGEDKILNLKHQFAFSHSKKAEIDSFRDDLKKGIIGTVLFGDVNPLYSGDKELKILLQKVEHRYSFSLYQDETSAECHGFIPTTHFLESWGDARAFDGTLSIQQPLIAPLNVNSLSIQDIALRLTKTLNPTILQEYETYYHYVKKRWERANWETVLRDGIYTEEQSGFTTPSFPVSENEILKQIQFAKQENSKSGKFTCLVTPSYTQYDGSMANNAWLQELPDPVSKMTWDNVGYISITTAKEIFGEKKAQKLFETYEKTELLRIKSINGAIDLPVWVQPGMQDGVIATTIGFGHTKLGNIANGTGTNAYNLMGQSQNIGYVGIEVEVLNKEYDVATTQKHHDLIGRKLVLQQSITDYLRDKKLDREEVPGRDKNNHKDLPTSIIKGYEYKGHRWGMVIDLSACVGCGACITACQSENNIPSVGKKDVAMGREMHWIRIDRYYTGNSPENPGVLLQPMLCQHCENAPCENVCPVAATTHSPEGLNEMTYNRCVGTKYCANNCPYKVRRFNWYNYHKTKKSPMELVHNPDVGVRGRGVMEKCSFCVHRINESKQRAKDSGSLKVPDGNVRTACQQACPAGALFFGNTNEPTSIVSMMKQDRRGFLVLEELNARPQITYLAKLKNDTQTIV